MNKYFSQNLLPPAAEDCASSLRGALQVDEFYLIQSKG